ncbi:MAG TPA: HAMP domain-containing sensor histidine kinase [Pyrinomonadaceae bacterium]|jgi:signal transduction histidine kinase
MNLRALFNSFRVRLLVLLAALLVLTLGVQYYVNLRAVRSNASLIVEQEQAIMAGVALGINSISSGQWLYEMRKETQQPVLDEQAGRIKNVLVVDGDGNIQDSLNRDNAPTTNPDGSKRFVRVKDVSLPPLNSAMGLATDNASLPEGMNVATQLRGGDPGAFYFPVETNKGRWYIIVVLGSASSLTNLLEHQARQSLLYTLAVLLVTTFLTTIVVWRFTRPIRYLSTAARRVALGDFSFRVPMPNSHDEMGELTSLFNEMTAKLSRTRELEAQLHQAEKAAVVGRLASAIAHEIRNPLNYINLTLDYLRTSFAPEEPEKRQTFARLAGQLKTEVARINTRISEFLNYSRPSELELESLDLYAISQDALRIIEAQAIESGIKTTVEKSGDIPRVMGDTEALRSMMTNLVINGVQAMDGGSGSLSILLAGEESGRRARIEVTDTGRGIAPEDISKVFEPYYSTKDTGTGLGLAIVKKAVDDHGGTINVTSKVGSGTTFIITLPAKGKGDRLRNGTQEHTRS